MKQERTFREHGRHFWTRYNFKGKKNYTVIGIGIRINEYCEDR